VASGRLSATRKGAGELAKVQTVEEKPKSGGPRGLLLRYRVWIGVAVSAILLYLTFGNQKWDKIGEALQHVNYLWLLPALVSYFVGVWLRALRWHFLLGPMLPAAAQAHASANRLFGPITIGYAANNILPLRTGELVRVLALKRAEGVAGTAALATIVIERIFDGITMLLFLVVAAMFVSLGMLSSYLIVGGIIFVSLLVGFIVVAGSPRLADRLLIIGLNLLPIGGLRQKVGDKARSFLNGLSALRSPRVAGTAMIISIILWLFEVLMGYLIAQGMDLRLPNGTQPPFYVFILMTAVSNLVLIIPSTAGGLGPFDAAINLVLASVFSIEKTAAATFAIIFRLTLWLPVTIVGLLFLSRAGIGWAEVTGGKEQEARHKDFVTDVEQTLAAGEHDSNNDNMEDDYQPRRRRV